jgi:tRNA-specific 2-thiouridylase
VAALLLTRQQYHVEGLFMKNWEEDDTSDHCGAAEDLTDAQAVCESLGIVLHTVNFAHEYWDHVFDQFLREYRAGRTPNPDVLCNKEIKFHAFLDHAKNLGAHYIATGHYARIVRNEATVRLFKGIDNNKDQSYFLHLLDQYQLSQTLFPLAELTKPQVRRLAQEAGFQNHAKRDSTGICFIGERNFAEFLNRFLPTQPGDIVDPQGHCLGRHNGLMFYTLGQRKGLGIGGQRWADGQPWYVADKDLNNNRLIVVPGDDPALYRTRLIVTRSHWVSGVTPRLPLRCAAKVRYRQQEQPCVVSEIGRGRLQVEFETPQRAITPGQSVVLYRGAECLGGGSIDDVG